MVTTCILCEILRKTETSRCARRRCLLRRGFQPAPRGRPSGPGRGQCRVSSCALGGPGRCSAAPRALRLAPSGGRRHVCQTRRRCHAVNELAGRLQFAGRFSTCPPLIIDHEAGIARARRSVEKIELDPDTEEIQIELRLPANCANRLEAATGIEPVHRSFADSRLTTWLRRHREAAT